MVNVARCLSSVRPSLSVRPFPIEERGPRLLTSVCSGADLSRDLGSGAFTLLGIQVPTTGGLLAIPGAINDRGDVVGQYITASEELHAFVWSRGRVTDLGTLGGPSSAATGTNTRGAIIGWAEDASNTDQEPVQHRPTTAN